MLALKYLFFSIGVLLIVSACLVPGLDLWFIVQHRRKLIHGSENTVNPGPVRWRKMAMLVVIGGLSLLIANSIVIVPSDMGRVRVGQTNMRVYRGVPLSFRENSIRGGIIRLNV